MAPGWSVDEQEIDSRLSHGTVKQIRQERAQRGNLLAFYFTYLAGLARGKAGHSDAYNRPVTELIADRAGTTIRSVLGGLLTAWFVAMLAGSATAIWSKQIVSFGAMSISGGLLSTPSAVLAIFCLLFNLPSSAGIAAVVFPRIYPHVFAQFGAVLRTPHIVMARARGISGVRLLLRHVTPGALPPLIGLSGATVPLAFGAAIPIEALSNSPGLGQLAWTAALGRDMPLLVTITLLLTAITAAANLVSDFALAAVRVRTP